MTVEIKDKIRNPANYYDTPDQVLSDPGLSDDAKEKVLKSMALDAKLMAVATAEGMEGQREEEKLGDVTKVLEELEEDGIPGAKPEPSVDLQGGVRFPYQRILVALNTDDPQVDEIISTAYHAAHEAGASLRFLTVVPDLPGTVTQISGMPTTDPVVPLEQQEKLTEEEVRRRETAAQDTLAEFAPLGESQHSVRRGVLDTEIVKYARDWPADLLIMGIHQRGWFEKLLGAPTATKVAENLGSVGCAVLLVPMGTDDG